MNKKLDNALFILGLVVIGLLLVGISFGHCANVQDSNSGNKGYILINDGTSGHRGTWTDIKTIPELKGEKGDKGDTGAVGLQGIQGIQGLKGDMGLQGIQGIKGDMGVAGKDGLNGLNGIDGLNGTNGIDGLKGDKGDTGANGKDVDPALVTALQDTDTTIQNNAVIETTQRTNTDTKLQNNINSVNSRVDDVSNRVSKLEKTQYNIRTELKFVREKHLEVGVYSVYSTTRNVCAEVGLNIVIPIGESYQDRENKRVNARLDRLERKLGATTIIERTLDKKGRVTSISIGNGQLSVNGGF